MVNERLGCPHARCNSHTCALQNGLAWLLGLAHSDRLVMLPIDSARADSGKKPNQAGRLNLVGPSPIDWLLAIWLHNFRGFYSSLPVQVGAWAGSVHTFQMHSSRPGPWIKSSPNAILTFQKSIGFDFGSVPCHINGYRKSD